MNYILLVFCLLSSLLLLNGAHARTGVLASSSAKASTNSGMWNLVYTRKSDYNAILAHCVASNTPSTISIFSPSYIQHKNFEPPRPPSSPPLNINTDITPPPGRFTCAEQKKFGKCNACWMTKGGFCKKTCGMCDVKDNTELSCFQDPPPSPQAEEDCNVEIEYADTESEASARARRCGKALAAGTEGGRASAETEAGEVASIARGEGSTAMGQSSPGQAFASSTVVGSGSASARARD